jgi:hypothetical protein
MHMTSKIALSVIVSFVLGFTSFGIPCARAELDTSSAPILMGTIDSAGVNIVTLKLEDGRKKIKFPRSAFPAQTDFFPGRIVTLKVTDELLKSLRPASATPAFTDAELVQIVRMLQESVKVSTSAKKSESTGLDFSSPHFEFLGISSAYAALDHKCLPISYAGSLIDFKTTDEKGKCTYEKADACPQESLVVAKVLAPGAKTFVSCAPAIYGAGICTPATGENLIDQATCSTQYSKRCTDAKLGEEACIDKFIMPYARQHAKEVTALAANLKYQCTPNKGPNYYDVVDTDEPTCVVMRVLSKQLSGKLQKMADDYKKSAADEHSANRCATVPGDVLNKNLDDKDSKAQFSTITGSMCGGQKLCVREVKCFASLGGAGTSSAIVTKLARCRAESCNSAEACLADSLATGSQQTSDLKKSKTSKGN